MRGGKVTPIEYPNGVRYNLFEPEADDPEALWRHTAFDLSIAVRAETQNRDLGNADMFLGVGEWGLAIEEILASIEVDPKPWDLRIQALADRAMQLLENDANSQKR